MQSAPQPMQWKLKVAEGTPGSEVAEEGMESEIIFGLANIDRSG